MSPTTEKAAIPFALGAAALFGLSMPAAKWLLVSTDPWLLAGLLYAGSGIGLSVLWVARRALGHAPKEAPLRRDDLPWLGGAIVSGGVVAPVLLMFGLAGSPASRAALLLNLEGVLTAGLAWLVFREHVGARIAAGLGLITAGAVILVWPSAGPPSGGRSALLVAGACLAWAVDNNLIRRSSGGDAMVIAALKSGAAGAANLVIAAMMGARLAGPSSTFAAAIVGFFGYGISLVLFVRALRHLGAARTGAYFSTAPFIGAVASIAVFGELFTSGLAVAGILMGLGVWLHVSERHVHDHPHEALTHEHLHAHDGHHRHEHEAGAPDGEPHSHRHAHASVGHAHPHYPDLHHGHGH